jgi:hypothetical protein
MKTPPLRTLALAIVATASLIVALGAGSASAERRASACASSNLVIWIPNGKGNGTAGSVYYNLSLTNSGKSTCTLQGYPRITAVTLAGKPLGLAATHESSGAAKAVQLASGAAAKVRVRITEAGNYSPSECHPTVAGGLAVTPPGQSAARIVPLPFEGCAALGQSLLGTSAVLK